MCPTNVVFYVITTLCCMTLAYQLLIVHNTLARMFGVLLLAVGLNAAVFAVVNYTSGHNDDIIELGFDLAALFMAMVTSALLIYFTRETRNGRHP